MMTFFFSGPVDLTEGTLIPSFFSTIPTVTDNLFTQGEKKLLYSSMGKPDLRYT